MKVAFHFLSSHPDLGSMYGYEIGRKFFQVLLAKRNLRVRTKIFVGDIFLAELCSNESGQLTTESVMAGVSRWLNTGNHVLVKIRPMNPAELIRNPPYVLLLDAVDYETVRYLCEKLEDWEVFVGAVEVDDTCDVHWALYQLIPKYRLIDRCAFVFWDGVSEESKDVCDIELLKVAGFTAVEYESLNGRYSFLDKSVSFENHRRHAEFRQKAGALLSFLSDGIVDRLGDLIPDISDRLWATMDALERAETVEQNSQVAVSCRKIVELVIDKLEPPVSGDENLREGKFKNRLKKYADDKVATDSTIEFVAKSGEEFKRQVDQLTIAANKGVHGDIIFVEARRCFIRMLVFLDDVLALNPKAFPIQIIYDEDLMNRIAQDILRRHSRQDSEPSN